MISSLGIRAMRAGLTIEEARKLSDDELDAATKRREREKARALKRERTEAKIRELEGELFCSPSAYVERFARWVGHPAGDIEGLARKAMTRRLAPDSRAR